MRTMALTMPPLRRSLSARLLLLTVAFVMLAEVFIFAPSVARYREDWLHQRLAAGHLAILALEATPDQMVSPELEVRLLAHAGALSIGLQMPGSGKLMLSMAMPGSVDATYDLRDAGPLTMIGDAFESLFLAEDGRLLRVVGISPKDPHAIVDMVIEEAPLRAELAAFALRILGLSLIISLVTAALVFVTLYWIMVGPMRRVTESLVAFRADPEHAPIFAPPAARADEIGIAGRELARLQMSLREALSQKTRLAALGTAVSKINHDLRNILSTARLVSDRLADSADPQVRRTAPTLLAAIDRAVTLCEGTLTFVREGAPQLSPERFQLADMVAEVGASLPASLTGAMTWATDLPADLEVEADRAQLFRVLANLAQNAVQAGAQRIAVTARIEGDRAVILVADNGPGLSPKARDTLFQPFAGSGRAGSTGLGLAIARELVEGHDGRLSLVDSSARGTTFRIELPWPKARPGC